MKKIKIIFDFDKSKYKDTIMENDVTNLEKKDSSTINPINITTNNKNMDNNEKNADKSNYSFNESDDLKMVFLVRQDLKMGAGKIAAQVAHAAIGLYDDILEEENIYQKNALNSWFNFGQKNLRTKDK